MPIRYQINKDDYQLWVESASVNYPPEDTMVTFWTKWTGAKNPDEMHRQFEQVFSISDLDMLIDVLSNIRDAAVVQCSTHQAL